jgi:hypothetical protein
MSEKSIYRSLFLLHVYDHPGYARDGVGVMPKVGQQLDDGVADFTVQRFPVPHGEQRARVVPKLGAQAKHQPQRKYLGPRQLPLLQQYAHEERGSRRGKEQVLQALERRTDEEEAAVVGGIQEI